MKVRMLFEYEVKESDGVGTRYESETIEGQVKTKVIPTAQRRARAKRLIEAAAKKVKQAAGDKDATG